MDLIFHLRAVCAHVEYVLAYFGSTVMVALRRNHLAPFSQGYPQIYTPDLWVTR
jgi:hypothetical protein